MTGYTPLWATAAILLVFIPAVVCQDLSINLYASVYENYFVSPGYPYTNYGSNVNCQWHITADPSSNVVVLTLSDVDIEYSASCDSDYLAIYDGLSTNFPRIQTVCGQFSNNQFMSTGPSMLVVFHSDGSDNFKGFQAYYMSKNKSVLCGNTSLVASASAKYLISPGYPNILPSYLDCQWTIIADTSSYGVVLNLLDISLPHDSSSTCRYGHVTIYDGYYNDSSTAVIQVLCDQYLNTQFTSTGPSMTVVLHSDEYTVYRGFKLEYTSQAESALCRQDSLVATLSAENLTSPGYPNLYQSNTNCLWITAADTSSRVVLLKLLDFYLEDSQFASDCVHDYVSIYDGYGTHSTQLKRLCGQYTSTQFISTGPSMTVMFHSDGSDNYRGFRFEYTSYFPQAQCINVDREATIYVNYLTSPGYPNLYTSNTDCQWVIKSDSPSRVVELKLLDFQLGSSSPSSSSSYCSYDYVSIYYGNGTSSPIIRQLCGLVSNTQFTSNGSYLTVVFHSDESSNYIGFKFEYTSKDMSELCTNSDVTATSSVQYFTSPNYPSIYPSNMACEWRIAASSSSQVVVLDLVDFYLEQSLSCIDDYVSIYDGSSTNSPLIHELCGQVSSTQFRSTGQYMTVSFHSDWDGNYKGFKFEYTSQSNQATCTNTSLWAYGYTQYLTSPGYPNNYQRNMACQWILTADLNSQVIVLNVSDFHLEGSSPTCDSDFVSIYDGPSSSSTRLQKLCGQDSGERITSTGSSMTIVFFSDGSNTFPGFNFGYIAQAKSASCTNSALYASSTVQYLTSPGYPSSYPSNVACQWVITADSSTSVVVLNFLDFHLEGTTSFCTYDFVSIFDGPSSGSYRIQNMCGQNTCDNPLNSCRQFTSSGSTMTVVFQSDGNENFEGFKFEYSSMEKSDLCTNNSMSATATAQNITSPSFPFNYQSDLDCQWIITSDVSSNVVLLKLMNFILEESMLCIKDYVDIYDGNSTSDPIIYELCGVVSGEQYASTGPYMTVVFHSDSGLSFSGFKFQYTSVGKSAAYSSVNLKASSATRYLTSPNFPSPYPINTDCQWQITADISSTVIVLELSQFSLKSYQPNCHSDNVQIYDGASTSSRLITVLCGSVHNGTYESTGSDMTVVFHSDGGASNDTGFCFTYHTQEKIQRNTGSYNQNNSPGMGAGTIAAVVVSVISVVVIVVMVSVYAKRRIARKQAFSAQHRAARPPVSETSLSVVDHHLDNRQNSQSTADPSDPPPYFSLNFDVDNSHTGRSACNSTNDLPPPPYSPALPGRTTQQGRTRLTSSPVARGFDASRNILRRIWARLNRAFDSTNGDEADVDHRTGQNVAMNANSTRETNVRASTATPTAPTLSGVIHAWSTTNDVSPSAPPMYLM